MVEEIVPKLLNDLPKDIQLGSGRTCPSLSVNQLVTAHNIFPPTAQILWTPSAFICMRMQRTQLINVHFWNCHSCQPTCGGKTLDLESGCQLSLTSVKTQWLEFHLTFHVWVTTKQSVRKAKCIKYSELHFRIKRFIHTTLLWYK